MLGVGRPPSHTALAALPVVALEMETTGLDVANDRIVQIGAVPMRGRTRRGAYRRPMRGPSSGFTDRC